MLWYQRWLGGKTARKESLIYNDFSGSEIYTRFSRNESQTFTFSTFPRVNLLFESWHLVI